MYIQVEVSFDTICSILQIKQLECMGNHTDPLIKAWQSQRKCIQLDPKEGCPAVRLFFRMILFSRRICVLYWHFQFIFQPSHKTSKTKDRLKTERKDVIQTSAESLGYLRHLYLRHLSVAAVALRLAVGLCFKHQPLTRKQPYVATSEPHWDVVGEVGLGSSEGEIEFVPPKGSSD